MTTGHQPTSFGYFSDRLKYNCILLHGPIRSMYYIQLHLTTSKMKLYFKLSWKSPKYILQLSEKWQLKLTYGIVHSTFDYLACRRPDVHRWESPDPQRCSVLQTSAIGRLRIHIAHKLCAKLFRCTDVHRWTSPDPKWPSVLQTSAIGRLRIHIS